MNNDPRRMFYTEEEIQALTRRDKAVFQLERFWYNLSEWFLTLKESDSRWMKNDV